MQLNFQSVGAIVVTSIILIVIIIVILTTIRRRYINAREQKRVMGWKQPVLSKHVPSTTTSLLRGADHGTREMLRHRNATDYRTGIIKTLPVPPMTTHAPVMQKNPFFIPELMM